jgi:hypothetical protein
MAVHSHTYEENLRRQVRDFKVLDPLITYAALTEKLNNRLNYSFDPRYIAKLARKVDSAFIVAVGRTQIEQWLIGIREHFRAACEEAKPKEFGTRQLSGPSWADLTMQLSARVVAFTMGEP